MTNSTLAITQKDIKDALKFVNGVIGKKPSIPVLRAVKLEYCPAQNRLKFTGTDLETQAEMVIRPTNDDDLKGECWAALADSHQFIDLLKGTKAKDAITLTATTSGEATEHGESIFKRTAKLTVTLPNGVIGSVPLIDTDHTRYPSAMVTFAQKFAEIPCDLVSETYEDDDALNNERIRPHAQINVDDLNACLSAVAPAMTKDTSRFILNAVKIETVKKRDGDGTTGDLRFIATNGQWIAKAVTATAANTLAWFRDADQCNLKAAKPAKTAEQYLLRAEAVKLVQYMQGKVRIESADNKYLILSDGDRRIVSRGISGRFPNWRYVYKTDDEPIGQASIYTGENAPIKDVAERTLKTCPNRSLIDSYNATMIFSEGCLTVSARGEDAPSEITLPLTFCDVQGSYNVRARHLRDIFKSIEADLTTATFYPSAKATMHLAYEPSGNVSVRSLWLPCRGSEGVEKAREYQTVQGVAK